MAQSNFLHKRIIRGTTTMGFTSVAVQEECRDSQMGSKFGDLKEMYWNPVNSLLYKEEDFINLPDFKWN